MSVRFAGDPETPVLPLLLAAAGQLPGPSGQSADAALRGLEALDPALLDLAKQLSGRDSRDYLIEPSLWRSDALPVGVSIDQAIRDGIWR